MVFPFVSAALVSESGAFGRARANVNAICQDRAVIAISSSYYRSHLHHLANGTTQLFMEMSAVSRKQPAVAAPPKTILRLARAAFSAPTRLAIVTEWKERQKTVETQLLIF